MDVIKAINHCHNKKVVHWDIKPENVMIGEDGNIKLIDFGLSQKNQTLTSKMSEQVGTPYYLAPEMIKGKYVDQCDMWSFGVLLYVMLSGYLPFTGSNEEEVYAKITEGKYSMA